MNKFELIVFTTVLLSSNCTSDDHPDVGTARVRRGSLRIVVTETGELDAVNSQTISAPNISWTLGSLRVASIVPDGKLVEQGEVVAEFDKTEVQKNLDDARANLDIALAEFRKAQASQNSEIEELGANLKKSEIEHRIKELELEKAQYEAEIDRKQIQLELERAVITLKKSREEIVNKKKVHTEELSKLELRVQQERAKVEEAEETLGKLTLRAPAPGIAVIKKSWSTGNKVQVDDDVWRGMPLIGLPDLTTMKATVPINEVDISKIDTTRLAFIRLEALPDTSFRGKVTEVAPLARNKERDSKVKVFDATILLAETDSTLMPGMTVSCEIVIDELTDVLYVPLEAVFVDEGETVIYKKNGSGFRRQSVSTGQENDDFIEIIEGAEADDEVALSNPFDLNQPMTASQ